MSEVNSFPIAMLCNVRQPFADLRLHIYEPEGAVLPEFRLFGQLPWIAANDLRGAEQIENLQIIRVGIAFGEAGDKKVN